MEVGQSAKFGLPQPSSSRTGSPAPAARQANNYRVQSRRESKNVISNYVSGGTAAISPMSIPGVSPREGPSLSDPTSTGASAPPGPHRGSELSVPSGGRVRRRTVVGEVNAVDFPTPTVSNVLYEIGDDENWDPSLMDAVDLDLDQDPRQTPADYIQSIALSSIPERRNGWLPAFKDPEMEDAYAREVRIAGKKASRRGSSMMALVVIVQLVYTLTQDGGQVGETSALTVISLYLLGALMILLSSCWTFASDAWIERNGEWATLAQWTYPFVVILIISEYADMGFMYWMFFIWLCAYPDQSIRLRYFVPAAWGMHAVCMVALYWGPLSTDNPSFDFDTHVDSTSELTARSIMSVYLLITHLAATMAGFAQEITHRANFATRIAYAREQGHSEALLQNILPPSIAERLKTAEYGEAIADRHDSVTIVFSDIVGFTRMCEGQPPSWVASMLNEIYLGFDKASQHRGVEKIKTIGDAYMAVAGAPDPRADHATAAALFALDMIRVVNAYNQSKGFSKEECLSVRVGLHTGPVVAGVIGESQFCYDLWGDTVNTASRMESHGIPGRVQLSSATADHLRDSFQLESRGEITVKGKGQMETFWLLGPNKSLQQQLQRIKPASLRGAAPIA